MFYSLCPRRLNVFQIFVIAFLLLIWMFHLLCQRQQRTNDMSHDLDTLLEAFPINEKHALSLTEQEECDLLQQSEEKAFQSWDKYCELQRRYMTEDMYKHDISLGGGISYPAMSTKFDTMIAEGFTMPTCAAFFIAGAGNVFPCTINGQKVMWHLAHRVRLSSPSLEPAHIPPFMKPRFVSEAIWIVDTVEFSIVCVSRLFVRLHFAERNANLGLTDGVEFEAGSSINDACVERVATCLEMEKSLGRPITPDDFPEKYSRVFAGCLGWLV